MRALRCLGFVLAVVAVSLAWNVESYGETFTESRRHAQSMWWGQPPSAPVRRASVDLARQVEPTSTQAAPAARKKRGKRKRGGKAKRVVTRSTRGDAPRG